MMVEPTKQKHTKHIQKRITGNMKLLWIYNSSWWHRHHNPCFPAMSMAWVASGKGRSKIHLIQKLVVACWYRIYVDIFWYMFRPIEVQLDSWWIWEIYIYIYTLSFVILMVTLRCKHFKWSNCWFSIFAKALAVMGQMRAMKKMRVKQVPSPFVGFDRAGFRHLVSSQSSLMICAEIFGIWSCCRVTYCRYL